MFKAPSEVQRQAADDMNRWLGEGKLKVPIGKRLSLDEAPLAHKLQEQKTLEGSQQLEGKIVVEIG